MGLGTAVWAKLGGLREHRAAWGEDKDEFIQHPSSPASLAWHKRMYEGGWAGLNWSKAYGGRGATTMEQVIFTDARPLWTAVGRRGPRRGRWGEDDAEGQRQALQRVAEEIALVADYDLPPDLEPRFF